MEMKDVKLVLTQEMSFLPVKMILNLVFGLFGQLQIVIDEEGFPQFQSQIFLHLINAMPILTRVFQIGKARLIF